MTNLNSTLQYYGSAVQRGNQEQPRPTSGSVVLTSWRESFQAVKTAAWENGITCASLACIIFSFSSLQVKLTGGRVPVLQLCIIRSSISFLTSIISGRAAGIQPLFGHKQHFPLLFLRGFFGTLAITTSYVSLLTLPLGDAITIAQMRPPVTAVMARVLLGEPLGLQGAAGCLLSVLGVVILAHPPFLSGGHHDWSQTRLLGTLSGIASTLCASGTSYAIRKIGKKEPALTVALWFHTTTICLLTWPLLAGIPEAAKLVAWHDCLLLLGIATASFLAQILMTRSYQLIAAARAAAVSFMGVIYSHILGALVFHERVTAATVGGGVLIFVGVILVTLKSSSGSSSSISSSDSSSGSTAAAAAADVQYESKLVRDAGDPVAESGDRTVVVTTVDSDDQIDRGLGDLSALQQQQQHLLQDRQQVGGLPKSQVQSSGLQRPLWLQALLSGSRHSVRNSGSSSTGQQQYQRLEDQPAAADLDQELAWSRNKAHHDHRYEHQDRYQDLQDRHQDHDFDLQDVDHDLVDAQLYVNQRSDGDRDNLSHMSVTGLQLKRSGRQVHQSAPQEAALSGQQETQLQPPEFELPTLVQPKAGASAEAASSDHHLLLVSNSSSQDVQQGGQAEFAAYHPSELRGQSSSWASWGSWRPRVVSEPEHDPRSGYY